MNYINFLQSGVVRRNPSDHQKTDILQHRVERFAASLGNWNLKYDEFPDIRDWMLRNWAAPYGQENAMRYLDAVMDRRSRSYWGLLSPSEEETEAFRSFLSVIYDLRGDEVSGKW